MKKREFIETALKAGAALLASFIAIILMECMIYGIYLNALNDETKNHSGYSSSSVVYAYEVSEGKYNLYTDLDPYNYGLEGWASELNITKAEFDAKIQNGTISADKIIYRTPNAFELSVEPIHYAVMAIFVLIVAGYFVYRFVRLNKSYKQIEDEFKRTGTIELTSM